MGDIKGRPKQAIVQEKHIGFFVTKKQYAVILRNMEKAHLNISDYMRQVAVNGQFKAKWTAEEWAAVKQLITFSADIHRLVVRAGDGVVAEAVPLFLQFRDDMDKIIETFCYER